MPNLAMSLPNLARGINVTRRGDWAIWKAVSLHFTWYNLGRVHQTLSVEAGRPTTPAMAAGVETHPWSTFQIAQRLD